MTTEHFLVSAVRYAIAGALSMSTDARVQVGEFVTVLRRRCRELDTDTVEILAAKNWLRTWCHAELWLGPGKISKSAFIFNRPSHESEQAMLRVLDHAGAVSAGPDLDALSLHPQCGEVSAAVKDAVLAGRSAELGAAIVDGHCLVLDSILQEYGNG